MFVTESKESIGNDLEVVSQLLNHHGLGTNVQPLYTASSECKRISNDDTWSYSAIGIELYADKLPHVIPNDVCNLAIKLSVDIEGKYYQEHNVSNPLNSIDQFDIEITGTNAIGEGLISSWHLDKHIHQAGDGTGKLVHPEYHLTYGGHTMENCGLDFGSALILRSPRILHPPMDAILGIDFILRNYVYKEFTDGLFEDSEYLRAVANSKNRLWKGYYIALASYWHNFPEPYNLDPNYVRGIVAV
jgi:hypothetical protein